MSIFGHALRLVLLALGIHPAVLTAAIVSANFEDGNGTSSVDQIPGLAGGGWTGPWSAGNLSASNLSFDAATTPPLRTGSGGHLRAVITGVNADSGLGRAFDLTTAGTGLDATKPATIRFSFRI
ncbi:MAG: hypothetical protein MUE42_14100, partial [Opitutaceae bacterium]|nr:hypothetical protein [Opitutaceae bacterium]